MQRYTKEEAAAAKELIEFYIDLVENHNSTTKFYLSENVVLDWFGKTIKNNKQVSAFLKEQENRVNHHTSNIYPSENIAFRDTHHVEVLKEEEKPLMLASSPETEMTPPTKPKPSTSSIEIGQGDGLHNHSLISPPKKMKFGSGEDNETVEGEIETKQLQYVTAELSVEFHRPSLKKLQHETRWKRPSKLHLGYTGRSSKDCTIYLIIYEGNLKCRRNLYKEFCDSEKNLDV